MSGNYMIIAWFLCMGLLQPSHAGDDCGNVNLLRHTSPDLKYWQDVEAVNQQLFLQTILARTDPDSILTIPVVVHVLHTGEPINTGSNISDARILAALNTTNVQWNDSSDRGAYMAIQFCLAQTDPFGKSTSGIIRIDASAVPQYESLGIGYSGDPGASETTLKNLSNWPHDRYYNIWVVNKIAGGWAGFAYYPTGSNFSNDGTIIAANSVQGGNETLAHEVGHGVGLYHTFQGGDDACPPNSDCTTEGDRVCDTPPHKKLDCILSPCTTSTELYLSTYNIMSYCNAIRNLFSDGQKIRCRNAVFTTTRAALLSSNACQSVPTGIKDHVSANGKIYPNPTEGAFTLELQTSAQEKLRVCNMLGQTMDEIALQPGNIQVISLQQNLAVGVYYLQIFKEDEVLNTFKLLLK